MNEIGDKLKAKREENGVSVEEAALDLKLRPSQIISLESGKREDFKDVVALKGIISDYAKYLGLDGDKLIDELNDYLFDLTSKIPVEAIENSGKKEEKEFASPYTNMTPKKSSWKVFVIVLVLIFAGVTIFLLTTNNDKANVVSEVTYSIGGNNE